MSATESAAGSVSPGGCGEGDGVDLVALAAGDTPPDLLSAVAEGRRQMEICNACRYCEGYCAVFPAMTLRRTFSDGDMAYLANLCHNCRGCYYACQYAPPHAFDINLPRALAEIRVGTWSDYAWPAPLGRAFARNGLALSVALALGLAVIMMLTQGAEGAARPAGSFYAIMPHATMVALFGSVFVLAIVAMVMGAVRFWRASASPGAGGGAVLAAIGDVLSMRHLSGGHGEGCNYEEEDVFSNRRRWLHHAAFYGFMLCFASTSAGTVLHYVFDQPAPYGPLALPKLLGVPGGILLCIGTGGLLALRIKSDPLLEARGARGMDAGFTLLLFLVGATGLLLYALRDTDALHALLAVHLGSVLAFFATMPYSRMVHGLYRFLALVRHAQEQRSRAGGAAA